MRSDISCRRSNWKVRSRLLILGIALSLLATSTAEADFSDVFCQAKMLGELGPICLCGCIGGNCIGCGCDPACATCWRCELNDGPFNGYSYCTPTGTCDPKDSCYLGDASCKPVVTCTPNCSCAATTAVGSTCADANRCGGWCAGTFSCAQNAVFVSQSVSNNGTPLTMTAGSAYSATVTMQNSGTCAWTAATSYKLGSQNLQDNVTWGGRVNLTAADTIGAGASKAFIFTVTAPATPGTYNFQWRMLQEGVAWFGGLSTNLVITVVAPAVGSAPSCDLPMSCPAPGTLATVTWTPPLNDVAFSLSSDGATVCSFPSVASQCVFATTPGGHAIIVKGQDAAGKWYSAPCGILTCVPPPTISLVSGAAPSWIPGANPNFGPTPQGRLVTTPTQNLRIENTGAKGSTLMWTVAMQGASPWLTFKILPSGTPQPLKSQADGGAADWWQDIAVTVNNVTPQLVGPGTQGEALIFKAPLATNGPTQGATFSLKVDQPPCGDVGSICGLVHDGALPPNDLPGVVVELRDANGIVKQTQTTGATTAGGWNYIFKNLTPGAKYFVSPVAGRNQVASPSNRSDTSPKDNMNFIFNGSVAKITVTDAPQTFVLITPARYTAPSPPAVGQGGGASYSAVIGANGQVNINVPSGSPYFIACWKANTKIPVPQVNADQINGGLPLQPTTPTNPPYPAACPAL